MATPTPTAVCSYADGLQTRRAAGPQEATPMACTPMAPSGRRRVAYADGIFYADGGLAYAYADGPTPTATVCIGCADGKGSYADGLPSA